MPFHLARTLAALAAASVLAAAAAPSPVGAAGDELMDQQWGLAKIGAPAAWARASGAGVRIGIVDSGVDLNHPDLAGKIVASAACVDTNGSDSQCQEGAPAQDIDGHGSHVAGIAAAATGNGTGIAGVAAQSQLVVARVFKKQSNGDVTARLEDLEAGIKYVISRGAKVVNLSLGVDETNLPILGPGSSENPLFETIQGAWNAGALPVVASGNSNQDLFGGSARYGQLNAIVVAATGKDDRLAPYSSPTGNAKWAIAAPGGAPANSQDTGNMILSTYSGGRYAFLAGTSQASPHVSGVAALLFSQGLDRQSVVDTILNTADKSVNCGSGCRGRLDAAKAVGVAPANSGPAPTSAPVTPAPTARPPRTTRPAVPPVTNAPAVTVPELTTTPETIETPTTEAPKLGETDPVIFSASPPEGGTGTGASAPLQAAGVVALVASASGVLWRRRALSSLA